jgi:hypothetical protein
MRGIGRVFADGTGNCWLVMEICPASAVVEDVGWLTFVSDQAIRQVWAYPAGWRGLSAEDLETMCLQGSGRYLSE